MEAYQAGRCMEVNTSSTSLIQCAGTLYERDAFLSALVSLSPLIPDSSVLNTIEKAKAEIV